MAIVFLVLLVLLALVLMWWFWPLCCKVVSVAAMTALSVRPPVCVIVIEFLAPRAMIRAL